MALTPGKAKKMLEDGTVHGRGLTDKQKRYFGAIAGGATPMKKINGGWLDKYQEGGTIKVNSKNDPRYKAYQDSLRMYNLNPLIGQKALEWELAYNKTKTSGELVDGEDFGIATESEAGSSGSATEAWMDVHKRWMKWMRETQGKMQEETGIRPDQSVRNPNYIPRSIIQDMLREDSEREDIPENFNEFIYKKPTQPVEIERLKPVSLLNSSGITPINVSNSIQASQMNVPRIPKSYEAIITPDANMANPNASWMSKEINVEGDEKRMEELLKMFGNSRSRDIQINPKYKMGGSLPGASGMMYSRSNTPPPLYTQSEMKAKSGGRCWSGYKAVSGKTPFSKGSCVKAQDGREIPKAQNSREIAIDNTAVRPIRIPIIEKIPKKVNQIIPVVQKTQPMLSQDNRTSEQRETDQAYTDKANSPILPVGAMPLTYLSNPLRLIGDIYNATLQPLATNIFSTSTLQPLTGDVLTSDEVARKLNLRNVQRERGQISYTDQMYGNLMQGLPETGWAAANVFAGPIIKRGLKYGKQFLNALFPIRNTAQTSRLSTYYIDRTGRSFDITSPSGSLNRQATKDALSAAKPNLKSTDLVNFTSTPTAATIANRINNSNSPVARKIIKDELLEISTEASKLREFQREAFRDLSSPEGFSRLVQMEEEYLKSIGYNMNKADVYRPIGEQAKINAQARLREILNANSKNQEAGLLAAQMDDMGDEQLMNAISKFFYGKPGKRMYNNASYSMGDMLPIDDLPPWIRREYINTMRNNKGKLPLNTQIRKDPILGGEITIPEIMVGRSWVNNKPIYAHEIIGHGLQKGRKMPQDNWIRNLIKPLDKNSPMWNKNSEKAYEYFMKGSKGREPMAFVQELRQALMESGLISHRYEKITPEIISNAQVFFQTKPMGVFNTSSNSFLSNTRIFDFMSPTSENFRNLSMILNKLPAALPPVIGAGLLGIDKGENQESPKMKNGGNVPKAQDGYKVPTRQGVRKNVDGSESTHLMKAEQLEDGTWVGFPSLFQNEDGKWIDMSGEKDWMNIYNEALNRGEVIEFGDDKESAIKFGEGSWKSPKMKNGGWLDKYEVIEDDMGQLTNPGKITKINSNNITMKGVDYPVLGISDTGDKKMMLPGKDYKFDGNSVTEFPMAQGGEKLEPLYKPAVPGYDQKEFLRQWTNSPMGQSMLLKSFDGNEKALEELTKKRTGNLDMVSINMDKDMKGLGRYKPNDHSILMNPSTSGFNQVGNDYDSVLLHELSHSQDYTPGSQFNKSTIPLSDQKLIRNLSKDSIKNSEDRKTKKENRYLADPTETRARLNVVRDTYQKFRDENMPSVFDSKFTPSMLEEVKGTSQFEELQQIYTDDEILQLLNTVSDNTKPSRSSNMAYAKQGRSLVTLDQLTNFTNYNTPQPGGWLDKY